MKRDLKILILEDTPSDAELVELALKKGGINFTSTRVETREAFERELDAFAPDAVLSDYNLPRFNGMEALRIFVKKGMHIPFILITGALPEEKAAECIREGMDDYLLKSNLSRLPSALGNALDKKNAEQQRKETLRHLRKSEERYRGLVASSTDPIVSVNEKRDIVQWNKAATKTFGYSEDEAMGKPVDILVPEEYGQRHIEGFNRFLETGERRLIGKTVEIKGRKKDGHIIPVELSLSVLRGESGMLFTAIIRDISERKEKEEKMAIYVEELERFQKATINREFRMKEIREENKRLKEKIGELEKKP
ncbi:MAG: PAS domain S-box protein [bacterium]|nr:PAS domain S-box protein [bacterium]